MVMVIPASLRLIGELWIHSLNEVGEPSSLRGKKTTILLPLMIMFLFRGFMERRVYAHTLHCQGIGEGESGGESMGSKQLDMKYDFTHLRE